MEQFNFPQRPGTPYKGQKTKRRSRRLRQKQVIKARLAQVAGWFCFYCGLDLSLASGNESTIDHYVPLARGGEDKIENMRLCCLMCGRAKANVAPAEFAAYKKRLANYGAN